MNICKHIRENPIYKIRQWSSSKDFETYVFVGKEPLEKNIILKLQKNGELSDNDKTKLKESFGDNYKNKLGLKDKGKVTYIFETIYNDDNINTLRKKISMYILNDIPDNHIYMWINKEVKKSDIFINNITNQIMQDKKFVTYTSFKTILGNYFNISVIDRENDERLEEHDVKRELGKLQISSSVEPFGTKYIHNKHMHFFEPNPFLNTSEVLDNDYEVITDRSYTLEHFKIEHNTINTTSYENVKMFSNNTDLLQLYFPWHEQNHTSKKDIFKTSDNIHNEVIGHINKLNDNDFQIDCKINYLHLRLNERNLNKEIKLLDIYESFTTTQKFPFVKYNTYTNKYYKVHKDVLGQKGMRKIAKDDFDTWTEMNQDESKMKSTHEYLMFKVFLKNVSERTKYATVLLFPDTHIDIKYSTKSTDDINMEDIVKTFIDINALIDDLKQLCSTPVFFPYLDRNFWMKTETYTEVKIVSMLSCITIINKSTKSTLHDVKLLARSLLPYLNVSDIETQKDDMLYLQYKRIDNFVKTDNITNFLNRNLSKLMNKDDIITKLVEVYHISEEEALRGYEQWKTSQKVELVMVGNGMYLTPANASNVTIKLKKSPLGFKAYVDGITRFKYHQRIVGLLKFLAYFSSKDKISKLNFIEFKLNENDKKEFDEEAYGEEKESKEGIVDAVGDALDDDDDDLNFLPDHNDLEGEIKLDFDFGDDNEDLEEIVEVKPKKKGKKDGDEEAVYDENEAFAKLKRNPETFQWVLNRLKDADKLIFKGTEDKSTDYSTKCQWSQRRQPIVITKEELERIDNDPLYGKQSYFGSQNDKDLPNIVANFGSDPEKRKKHIYICPEIWCPLSRVSMTKEQFLERDSKCPNEGDVPIDMTHGTYWTKGKPRYISFVEGDNNICMPCCFKKKPEIKADGKPNENMKAWNRCTESTENKPKNSPSIRSFALEATEKYIVGVQYPLEENRYGILPKALSAIFKNKKCGSGGEGTGLIIEGTDCFLRKGIQHHRQSFLSCMKHLLLTDESTNIVQYIIQNLTLDVFLTLNNGSLCGMFINDNKTIYDPYEFKRFAKWFTGNVYVNGKLDEKHKEAIKTYIKTFKLNNVYDTLMSFLEDKQEEFNHHSFPHFKHVLREYIIYNSYTNFINYLQDHSIIKTHDILLDLFNKELEWINPKGVNVIVFEVEKDNVFISCPINPKNALDLTRMFVFVVKQGDIYEPIFKVTQQESSNIINTNYMFKYTDGSQVKNIIDFYKTNCKFNKKITKTSAEALIQYIETLGYKVWSQVLDYNFQLVGFILKGNVFIPCKPQYPIIKKNNRFIYIDQIKEKLGNVDYEDIKLLLSSLYELTHDEYYKMEKVVVQGINNDAIGIITKSGASIPLSKINIPQELYMDNLNIFLGWEDDDERKLFIQEENYKNILYTVLKNELSRVIENHVHTKDEIQFLRSATCPFSIEFRKAKLNKLLDTFFKRAIYVSYENKVLNQYKSNQNVYTCSDLRKTRCNGICKWKDKENKCSLEIHEKWVDTFRNKLVDLFLKPSIPASKKTLTNSTSSDQIIFEQQDIINGKITKLYSILKNPYMYVDKVIDDYVKEILETEIKVKKTVTLSNILSTEWYDLLGKFNKEFNGKNTYDILKQRDGFGINKQPIMLKSFITDLFRVVNKLTNSHAKVNESIIKYLVKNRLIDDYKKHSSVNAVPKFVEYLKVCNASFAYLAKKLYKKRDELTLQEVANIFDNEDYVMSEYELTIMAQALNIRIYILARKGVRNPNEIKCIKPSKTTSKYILLFQSIEEPKDAPHFDRYEVIAKNIDQPQIVFDDKTEIRIAEYLQKMCIRYFAVEV